MKSIKQESHKVSLAEFITQQYELFRTDGNGVIAILSDGSNLPINHSKFRELCADDYCLAHGETPPNKDLVQAIMKVRQHALAKTPIIDIVDGNEARRKDINIFRLEDASQLAVTAEGTAPVSRSDSGVHFTKSSGSGYANPASTELLLPNILAKHLNMATEQIILFIGCLVKCFMPGPNPIMLFIGPQGSGKTLAAKVFQMIVDPDNDSDRIQILDNISCIGGKLSDDLCRAAHNLISLLTTIVDQMPNQDKVDRTIVFDLNSIPDEARRPETKILAELKADLPAIMWWIFSALSAAHKNYQEVELLSYPRLADFVQSFVAACPGLEMNPDDFLEALDKNRIDSVERSLNQNPVSAAILDFMDSLEETKWSGTGTELLDLLNNSVDDDIKKHSSWPSKPNKLSAMLNRAAPFLKTRDLDIQWAKSGQRSITLTRLQPEGEEEASGQTSMVEYHELQSAANVDADDDTSAANQDPAIVETSAVSSETAN